VLDNVYMLGRPGGKPSAEDTPLTLRQAGRARESAHGWPTRCWRPTGGGDVQAVTGRASDFFGPGGLQTMFEARLLEGRARRQERAESSVNPDTLHTYHYIPDVPRAWPHSGAAGIRRDGSCVDAAMASER